MEYAETTSRAIIIVDNNKLITIKKTKYDKDEPYSYYTIPGGHVELGETFEETTKREIKEELGIEIKVGKEFESICNLAMERFEKFFICEYVSGKLGTGTGEEWQNPDIKKYGKYEIELIDIDKILDYNLFPVCVKEKIYDELRIKK